MKKKMKFPALSGTQLGMILTGSLCLLIVGMILVIQSRLERQISTDTEQTIYYDRHYAMLLEDNADPFWASVYDSAKQTGEEENVCVELVGESLPLSLDLADKLSLVIHSRGWHYHPLGRIAGGK